VHQPLQSTGTTSQAGIGILRQDSGHVGVGQDDNWFAKLCYNIMACECASDVEEQLVWTWADMCLEVGAEETISRITGMVTNLAMVAALVTTLTVAAQVAIPVPVEGSHRHSVLVEENGTLTEAYEKAIQAYGLLFGSATMCLASSMVLCITVLIQLNTVKWDVPHLVAALQMDNAQSVISIWCFQFFNIGTVLTLGGILTSLWVLYEPWVFYSGCGALALSFLFSMYKGAVLANAFMQTWKAGKRQQLSTYKLKQRRFSFEDYEGFDEAPVDAER